MAKPVYQAAVDTVGGDMVSAILPQLMPEGAVTTCGMIDWRQGLKRVCYPFILRWRQSSRCGIRLRFPRVGQASGNWIRLQAIGNWKALKA